MYSRQTFRNCAGILGPDLTVEYDIDIVVEDDIISEVGPGVALGEGPLLSGVLVVPGLINAHTHIGDAVLAGRGFGLDPADLLWPPDGFRHRWMAEAGHDSQMRAMKHAAEWMLTSGTVAFADFREQGIVGVRQLREAIEDLSIHAQIFGRHEEFPLHSEAELIANSNGLTSAQVAEIDQILDIADGFTPLWANDTTDLGLRQTAETVRAKRGRLATHAGETPTYREISKRRTGLGDVERIVRYLAPDFIVHMTAASVEEFAELAGAGIPAVMCPRTQAALGNGIPPLLTALDSGVTVALGTDNAMVTPPDMLGEMTFFARALRAVARDAARPSARELLATCTTSAAQVLGLSATHGHIAPGRNATFFLVDMNGQQLRHFVDPLVGLVTAAAAQDVLATFINGRLVYGKGLFETHGMVT